MRLLNRRSVIVFLFAAALGINASSLFAAEAIMENDLSRQVLDSMVSEELKDTLSAPQRFVPFPNNVALVSVSPRDLPCFALSHDQRRYREEAKWFAPDTALQSGLKFLLVTCGSVLGCHGREVVVALADGKVFVLGGTAPHEVALPAKAAARRAFFAGGKWTFLTASGIISEDTQTPWNGSADIPVEAAFIRLGDELIGLWSERTEGRGGFNDAGTSVVAVAGGDRVEKRFVRGELRGRRPGLVKCADGRWLVISGTLTFASPERKGPVTEKDFDAVFEAIKGGDRARLSDALAEIGLRPQQLRGLMGRVAQLPDDAPALRRFQETLAGISQELDRVERMPAGPAEKDAVEKLRPRMAQYREETRKLAAEIAASRGADESPRQVAQMLMRGLQLFDGRWVGNAFPVIQEIMAEAVLWATFYDRETAALAAGLFAVGGDGRLKQLCVCEVAERLQESSPPRVMRDNKGSLLAWFQGKGLARVEGGQLNWIDTSERMKAAGIPLGCDAEGRLYFGSERYARTSDRLDSMYGSPSGWIYRAEGEAGKDAPCTSFPFRSMPTLDTKGRLWFACPPDEIAEGLERHGLPRELPPPALSQEPYQMVMLGVEAATKQGETRRQFTLAYYEKGGFYGCAKLDTDITGLQIHLIAGLDGSVVARTPNAAYLVHGNTVYSAKDLHELAQQKFDLMLSLAPVSTLPSGLSRDVSGNERADAGVADDGWYGRPFWLKVKDVLWISDGNRARAYRQGQSLLTDELQALEERTPGEDPMNPMLLGPLAGADGPRLWILPSANTFHNSIWAVQTADGLKLTKATMPPQGMVDLVSTEVSGVPLLSRDGAAVFIEASTHDDTRTWEVAGPDGYGLLADGGAPVLTMPDGRLLVRRYTRGVEGFRLVSKTGYTDLTETYRKRLRPVFVEADGRLLCRGQSEIVWVTVNGDGSTTVSRSIPVCAPKGLGLFLGRAADELFFVTSGGRDRECMRIRDEK